MGYGTDGLTFNTLRNGNIERLPMFKNCHGKPAHTEPDGSDWSPAQWLQAVLGELGEYANLRKKFERGDIDEDRFLSEAANELADVMTYLDLLAFRLGINLGEATMNKWNAVSRRVGANIRIDHDDWHYTTPPEGEGITKVRQTATGTLRLLSTDGLKKAVFYFESPKAPGVYLALHDGRFLVVDIFGINGELNISFEGFTVPLHAVNGRWSWSKCNIEDVLA